MPLRIAAPLFILAALIAVPAGARAASVVRPSSVNTTSVLTAGAHTIRSECPSPSVALNAAVIRKSPGVTVRRSIPGRGAGDWRFRVGVANGGSRVRSVLRCVRLDVPAGLSGASLEVKTRRQPGIAVPVGGATEAAVRCGSGWVATGYGLDAGASGSLRLASVVPVARGWNFVLENVGPAPVTAGVSARCLRRRVGTTGAAELRFGVTRPSRGNTVGTDSTPTFSHGCGTGRFSLATGSIVDPRDTIELAANGPVRSQFGRWTFAQASAGDRVRTFLVCLSRSSGFN
jgi:hypothetical protein